MVLGIALCVIAGLAAAANPVAAGIFGGLGAIVVLTAIVGIARNR